jgi:hypothetical protein
MSSVTDQVPTPSTASTKRARSTSPAVQETERDAKRANLGDMNTETEETTKTEKVESLNVETPVEKAVGNEGSAPQ